MSELSLIVKATAILGAGLLAASLARRARASWRHAILGSTLLAVLLLPAVMVLTPEVAIPLPIESAPAVMAPPAIRSMPGGTTRAVPVQTPIARETARSWMRSWPVLMRTTWIGGTIVVLLALSVSLWRFRQLRRHGLPWIQGATTLSGLASAAGISTRPDVVLHEDLSAPATCGWRRATILLPTDAAQWPDAEVRCAMVHELEHIRRGDWGVLLMARAACAVFWFHPLAWLALGRLSLEAERACDDAVLRAAEQTDYAEQLVRLARRMSTARPQPLLAMAKRSDLATRVTAILDGTQQRGRLGVIQIGATWIVAATVVLGIAPLHAVGAARKTGPSAAPKPAAPAAAQRGTTPRPSLEVLRAATLNRALLEAAEHGDVELMGSLVASGANVNGAVPGDGSPLIAAARRGGLDAVRWLLDRGADPNLAVPGDGNPLIMAAQRGRVSTVQFLLERGADIDRVVQGDENPLITASEAGQLEVVKLLVTRGANVNARAWVDEVRSPNFSRPGEWRTPLNMAQRNGHDAIVRYLKSAGAQE